MQIHVVQAGQSLYRISQAYGVPVDAITSANEILPSHTLVIGQALVIPIVGQYYYVVPGDTLSSIAARFGTTAARLASVNETEVNAPLNVGTRLYIPPMPKRRAYVNAYIAPSGMTVSPALTEAARQAAPHLTYLAPSSFRIQRDGTLALPPLGDLRSIAAKQRTAMMLTVTNLEEDQFSSDLGHLILSDTALQDKLIANIVRTAKNLHYQDVHFDLEHLLPEDREPYNRFLRKAVIPIHAAGLTMSTALAPKTSATQEGAWYSAHDYRAHGEIADFVIIMTYEWGYSGGPPMPVSPIGPVRTVLEYALTEMPAGKIMMGQNLYGYDWTLPYVPGGAYAKAISPQAAIALARQRNAEILYDTAAQAPHFTYWDDNGKEHRVWFEDARSIQAKFNLMKQLRLRGISYWKLGLSFPQNWLLLEDNFDIVKLLP
ncbi:LysM peptidoglycan-binding domain-containing protein [Paenibacillus sacheonensis]|uniref:LysM peptidoglycan-binding domain-containing protein n=1 Tax=Paenibacillus sacheonensis TaxID=742054 RepID=A0A7X4YTE4_9BACL|nr:glycoside hydrolase family 18 protein [Paenibacillus sacheonensis]MBM7568462.1 spore germination protein [Paenibacillus sacheonensis]NBC72160.1 LysM peptidoglycan-binding domain-containing protein [Paenibacillus sacheonensis]